MSFPASGSRGDVVPFRMEDDGKSAPRFPTDELVHEVVSGGVGRPPSTLSGRMTAGGRKTASSHRPGTSGSSTREYNVVVLIENRAREVGLAVCNLSALHSIQLIQLHDSNSYTQTLSLLQLMSPVEIVMAKSQSERVLFQNVVAAWGPSAGSPTMISTLSRRAFDDTLGLEQMRNLATNTNIADFGGKYLALASLAALLKYIEMAQNITLADRAIQFSFRGAQGRMTLDFETIKNLELLANARTGATAESLFGVLDHTQTMAGMRFLRSQIMSPVNDGKTLEMRLDCVEELIKEETILFSLRNLLPKLLDFDLLLSQLASKPKVATLRTARASVGVILGLKHVLQLCPAIVTALALARNPLLVAIRTNLSHDSLAEVSGIITTVIVDEAAWQKSLQARNQQECFAIRPHVDGSLDAARKLYVDTLTEIESLVATYRTEWDMPQLRLHHTGSRGYHMLLPATVEVLPPVCVQPVRHKTAVACSSEELSSLNDRVKETLFNIHVMTHVLLQDLLSHVRDYVPYIMKVAESVGMLDFMVSGANYMVSATNPASFTRPVFMESGPIAIIKGRHPIIDAIGKTSFVPNDVYLDEDSNLQLLTGPNCSGKSTLLKQVALLTVMAQIGYFVPAEYALFRISDRLCTRIGTSDDIEANASTFFKEMKEAAYILDAVQPQPGALGSKAPRCLVLIDELGRGTSNEDGVGIAWAVCEQLISSRAYTICVTHYHELTELGVLYPNVRTSAMAIETTDDTLHLKYTFTLVEGSSPHKTDYGIKLAELCGLPQDVIVDAKRIKALLALRSVPRPALVAQATIPGATAAVVARSSSIALDGDSGTAVTAGTPRRHAATAHAEATQIIDSSLLRRGLTTDSSIEEVVLHTSRSRLMAELGARARNMVTLRAHSVGEVREALATLRDEYAPQFAALGITHDVLEGLAAREPSPSKTLKLTPAVYLDASPPVAAAAATGITATTTSNKHRVQPQQQTVVMTEASTIPPPPRRLLRVLPPVQLASSSSITHAPLEVADHTGAEHLAAEAVPVWGECASDTGPRLLVEPAPVDLLQNSGMPMLPPLAGHSLCASSEESREGAQVCDDTLMADTVAAVATVHKAREYMPPASQPYPNLEDADQTMAIKPLGSLSHSQRQAQSAAIGTGGTRGSGTGAELEIKVLPAVPYTHTHTAHPSVWNGIDDIF